MNALRWIRYFLIHMKMLLLIDRYKMNFDNVETGANTVSLKQSQMQCKKRVEMQCVQSLVINTRFS